VLARQTEVDVRRMLVALNRGTSTRAA
jgi:hypothetical protein